MEARQPRKYFINSESYGPDDKGISISEAERNHTNFSEWFGRYGTQDPDKYRISLTAFDLFGEDHWRKSLDNWGDYIHIFIFCVMAFF